MTVESQGHPLIRGKQLPDNRDPMALDVLEEQRRTVRPLVVNLADRAELVPGIDFRFDFLQLVLFFQYLKKLAQVHHAWIILFSPDRIAILHAPCHSID